jgi:hypothetical protein
MAMLGGQANKPKRNSNSSALAARSQTINSNVMGKKGTTAQCDTTQQHSFIQKRQT